MAIALTGGLVLGLTAGYLSGLADNIILVVLDTFSSIPVLMLALTFLAMLGPSLVNLVVVIGLSWSPGYARIVRAQVLAAKQNVYVEAERSLGASTWRIAQRHILPNILPPILIMAAMDLPWVIIFEAGLSFLGMGVRPPTPSWGAILSEGYDKIRQSPWPITWAGLTLVLMTLGFTLLGETLRDVLDPRLAGTREG
jgi:peptide/nickel transport system permease protein